MTTIHEHEGCRVTLEVADRIEYTVDERIVVSTPLEGADALSAHLGQPGRLVEASRAAAGRGGFARYAAAGIASELRRWCHQAGLPSLTYVDGRRTRREHVIAMVLQPGTDRNITLSLAFGTDEVSFTEEYRAPDEVLGYSYGIAFPDDNLDHLGTGSGDPEERLIAAVDELVVRGVVDPLAGQGAARDLIETWCRQAGVTVRRRGVDRRETLVQVATRADQVAEVMFTIATNARRLGFIEGWGPAGQTWRDGLYQLQIDYDQLEKLQSWLTEQVGPVDGRLGVQDAVVAGWRVLAGRGELTPRRPMEVRDRVARGLAEAGVVFRSYGSAWRETLLREHRANDCIFTLSLTIDPAGGAKGIMFTEFYDYGPSGDDPGREYGYSVHAPYDALETLADAYAPDSNGPAQDRLIAAFRHLAASGGLGDHKLVRSSFEAAGVTTAADTWVWHNSE